MRQLLSLPISLFLLGLALAWTGRAPAVHGEGNVQFNRDIRPILTENCFACHGPDATARAADLRLDIREEAIDGGAIDPGAFETSPFWERITSTDPDSVMPPPHSHKSLTDEQKLLLRQWLSEGAPYEGHWAFIPPKKPELPQVRNSGWVRNPIDRFVLAELERRGIEPSPEADLRSLIRRVRFDLTGLPPSPEEIKRVLDNPSPNRYEEYVSELLDRSEWGEHRGRHWLDYARYADTHGIHFDNFREMWAYRDWVINAFNRNLPFDQFTIEQLAGDLLPNADLDQKIASGFNRCNITTNEGGIIDEEYRVLYTRDRVETTGLVWLGLTVGCAVCHDHKYDPVTQAEFYQLAAFFNNTTQPVKDGNIKNTPPIIQVPPVADRARVEELAKLVSETTAALAARRESAHESFYKHLEAETAKRQTEWTAPETKTAPITHLPLNQVDSKWLDVLHDGQLRRVLLAKEGTFVDGHVGGKAWKIENAFPSLAAGDFERDQAYSVALWVKPNAGNQGGALIARMDEGKEHRGWDVWMENGSVGSHIISNWPDDSLKVVSRERLTPKQWSHVAITYDGSSKADGLRIFINGKEATRNVSRDQLKNSIRTEVPLTLGRRSQGAPAAGAALQDVRIYNGKLEPNEIDQIRSVPRKAYLQGKTERTPEELEELFSGFLREVDPVSKDLNQQLANLQREEEEIRGRSTFAHIMNEATSEPMAYILLRGDYDKRSDEVKPAVPAVLPQMPEDLPKDRLGFAKWLMLPDHPLTSRVTVNRFWQEIFGRGIVPSAGDFGVTGQMPTHPELLDYLAVQFQEDDWNVKEYFRQIVTSATYRQSANVTAERYGMDPDNKLLARGPRFRMDAEMIRDSALAVSGLLVPKIGGPSVYPYQPPGVWEAVAMPESNTKRYPQGTGEELYRRSMYTFLKRSAPPPNMEVFNATAREVCTIRRERTNTPLQALVTLNDPQFVEAARILATKMLSEPNLEKEFAIRAQWIAEKLIGRPFRAEEIQVVQQNFDDLSAHYTSHADDAALLLGIGETKSDPNLPATDLAAWTMLCNQLMNLDEVITK